MPLDVSRIHALCFDVDGTLSNSDDQMVAQLSLLLHPFRVFLPGKNSHRIARRLVMASEAPANFLIGLPDLVGADGPIFALVDWAARNFHTRPNKYWLIHGVRETLADLSRRYPLAVVSARDARTTGNFLAQFDLLPYFHCVATAQTCEHTKPFPDPVLWAAGQMGVSPEDCLMIGDTSVDILAGKAAGAQTLGVLCGFGEEAELRRKGADLVLAETAELLHVLSE
ncbi:MAG: HAD family hydrolase [Anaerolineales bacterium]|jgi:HAD superfamily hydrolase (TIGR01509 family)